MTLQLTRRTVGKQLKRVFHWWLSEISPILPLRIAAWFGKDRVVLISAAGSNLRLSATHVRADAIYETCWLTESGDKANSTSERYMHRISRSHLIDLMVPEEYVLRQTITLPYVAREDLRSAVAFGLPTWSPFTPDEVYFAEHILASDAKQITVGLRYTLRTQLHPLIQEASERGFAPDRLIFDPDGVWNTYINPGKGKRIVISRRVDATLAITALSLALAIVPILSWRQSKELAAYQSTIHSELVALKKEEAEHKHREELQARQTVVGRKRAASLSVTEILTAIGEILPPSTAVTTLEISSGKGKLEASSIDGAALVKALRETKAINNIKLGSTLSGRLSSVSFDIGEAIP